MQAVGPFNVYSHKQLLKGKSLSLFGIGAENDSVLALPLPKVCFKHIALLLFCRVYFLQFALCHFSSFCLIVLPSSVCNRSLVSFSQSLHVLAATFRPRLCKKWILLTERWSNFPLYLQLIYSDLNHSMTF